MEKTVIVPIMYLISRQNDRPFIMMMDQAGSMKGLVQQKWTSLGRFEPQDSTFSATFNFEEKGCSIYFPKNFKDGDLGYLQGPEKSIKEFERLPAQHCYILDWIWEGDNQ